MNKLWEDWRKKKIENQEKSDDNKKKTEPKTIEVKNLKKVQTTKPKSTIKKPKKTPENASSQNPSLTVTVKGKQYTNIQEFLRQRAGTNLYEQSDSEHLPKHPGIAAERGKGHTADTAD